MANIKLKTGVGIPPFLEVGEPAFDIQNNVFYIGDINGIPINVIDLNLSKKQFGVGKKYYNQEGVEQGEIFNDCNNIANALYSHAEGYNTSTNISTAHVEGHSNNGMIKAYHILAQSTENPFILTLDSVENIEANMQFNIFVQTEEGLSKYRGTIGSVDSENNTVTLSSTEYSNEMFAGIFENYTFDIENKSLVMNLIVDGGKVGSFSVIDTTNNFSQHIEGKSNFAGLNGHAEGYGVFATGYSSHAEGYFTTASGERSHSEGYRTIASGNEQHVQGRFNVIDTENKYAHIVGNGTANADTARKNIHTLDWEGNAWFSGKVTVGSNNEELATMTELNEISNKLSSVYKFCGTVDRIDDLPTEVFTGDVYNVKLGESHICESYIDIMETSEEIEPDEYGEGGGTLITITGAKLVVKNISEEDANNVYGMIDNFGNKVIPVLNKEYDSLYNTYEFLLTTATRTFTYTDSHSDNIKYYYASYIQDNLNIEYKDNPDDKDVLYYLVYYSDKIFPGDNVAYTDGNWEKLGSGVDLSSFAQNDLSNVSNDDFKAKAIQANINSSVISVNGQTGEVNLTINDIDNRLTIDDLSFQYNDSNGSFKAGYEGLFANGDVNGGYNFSVDCFGLNYSGSPSVNHDIVLNQIKWIDENDSSLGTFETTHKLSEKANSKDVYTKDEVDSLIASSGGENVLPSSIIINSSTPGSAKQFKITIDDNGTLTATELEGNE